ncbi:cupin-like domain-containing protein [Shewanella mesophila]|uniref:cupin-like domain-containing protein n=1 Tax=Shewanella mesophila TaxID=2864208 RepID=UPI001C660F1A|nr:cupin-like domain-containing protein [Shewanella mesophila]QYJ84986.1 cupin-like domain-containing protein [Shewanella mesophila]
MLAIKQQVQCITTLTPGVLPAKVVADNQPVILKGFCDHWPIVTAGKQSLTQACDYLCSLYSGRPVTGYMAPSEANGRVFYNAEQNGFNYSAARIDLPQVLARILSHQDDDCPPTLYVGSTDVTQFFPGFSEHNTINVADQSPLTNIWLGNRSRIAAHYDFPHNVACSAVGRRRFTLFPPSQVANLYPGPMEFSPGGQTISMVDFDAPDFTQFPKFSQAIECAQVALLEAGDALFLPSMWWHHVEGLDPLNVLVTHWWRDSPSFMGRPDSALLHAMLSLRSLPEAQRQAWKHIFNHYIFDHQVGDSDHILPEAQGMLTTPQSEHHARQLRAELLNRLKR